MSKGTVTRASLAAEIDGKVYFVALPQARLVMLMQLAASLFDDGKLTVVPAPADYKFQEIPR
jgi:hypothetical protein